MGGSSVIMYTILVTGGAGYVGSHTILELLKVDSSVICVDNVCNAYMEPGEVLPESLKRVEELTGKKIIFYKVDIRDRNALEEVFKKVITKYLCFIVHSDFEYSTKLLVWEDGFQLGGIRFRQLCSVL